MKKYLDYSIAVAVLGSFMGVLMSMGHDILFSIALSCGFWACMLAPMLIDEKG
jgi:hypothetical protein